MPGISRAEMVAAINNGGSVMLQGGAVVGRIEDLPTEADLAKASGDAEQIQAAQDSIDAQIKALEALKAKLNPAANPTPPPLMQSRPPEAVKAEVKPEVSRPAPAGRKD